MVSDVVVLYVDDHAPLRDLTMEMLERAKPELTVWAEADPTNVTDRLASEPIDCVVSDYDMPQMTGLELFEQVRREHPEMPFFLFTNNRKDRVTHAAFEAGVTDYIQKEQGLEQYSQLADRVSNAGKQHRERRLLGTEISNS